MLTEQEHLRSLIDALNGAASAASTRLRSVLRDHLRQATIDAVALAFYRDQQGWSHIAALLDTASKHPIRPREWSQAAANLRALRDRVRTLANRGVH